MLKKLNNLQIKQRLSRAFIIVAGVMSLVSVIALVSLVVISNQYSSALVNYGFAQGDVGKAMAEFADCRSSLRAAIGYDDQSLIDSAITAHGSYKSQFEKEFDSLESSMVTSANKKLYSEITSELSDYWKLAEEIMDTGASTDEEKSKKAQEMAVNELMPMYDNIYENMTEIMDIKVTRGDSLSDSLSTLSIILVVVIIVVIIIAIAIALYLSKGISNSIAIPITELKDRLETFAKGDLSSQFPTVDTKDEVADMVNVAREMADTLNFVIADEGRILGEMAASNYRVESDDKKRYAGEFSKIIDSIHELRDQMVATIRAIEEASSQVSAGSGNLAEASQSLAEGATEQAGAVEELQATVTTITENMKSAADNAEEAYMQAQKYSSEADNSRAEMKAMVEAMERINETSQKIENIISEIEDIASQTNLLSLNASIEAARAGEAGRGFAVVADQISQLAEQSTKSAVETRDLIKGSLQEISEGNRAAERMAASLETVVEGIQEIAASSKTISTIATEQSVSMGQAEQGAIQISEVVQANSAIAEESSATSEELSAQAISLDELISKFILPD